MQATFFATDADLLQVAHWFLEVPGMRLFESASRPDQPNRWFLTVGEVAASFAEPGRNFAAWLEKVGARPEPRYTEFEPNTQRRLGVAGRTVLESPSAIAIHRNNDQNGCLCATHISCWNERGARQRSIYSEDRLNAVDWKVLHSVMADLQRKLSKASPARIHSKPIMADAFSKLRDGKLAIWKWGTACMYPSPDIVRISDAR